MNLTTIRVGFYLAYRSIKRSSLWTTVLIIFVMTLTFLNLVVVSGVLVGLIQGSVNAHKERYSGDIMISKLQQKAFIENSDEILSIAKNIPAIDTVSGRYLGTAKLDADYNRKLNNDERPNVGGGQLAGIDPEAENKVTNLSKYIIEGRYLNSQDTTGVMVGATLLYKYTKIDAPGIQLLRNVEVGDKVKLSVGKNSEIVTIVGVLKTKAGSNDQRVFMLDHEVRKLIGRNDLNLDEISIKLKPNSDAAQVKQIFLNNNVDDYATVQVSEESEPQFLKDIKATFALLGNMIGAIGLAVASITIFIVIFVNAITRRKFIGILKGIGIDSSAIEISYVFQSIFYALVGIGVACAILYGFLVPYVDAHPINFPFSDGIIYAPLSTTLLKAFILMIATVIAGYIPARLIVQRNTLDAILGR